MRSLRLALAALVLFVAAFLPANAAQKDDTCITQSTPFVVNYAAAGTGGTGTISITYSICYSGTNYSNIYWSSTMTYNNVSWGGGFSVNGSLGMQLDINNSVISSVSFNGGPLTYQIGANTYTVTFNNLAFNFTQFPSVGSASGSLVINGATYNGATAYWPFLFH